MISIICNVSGNGWNDLHVYNSLALEKTEEELIKGTRFIYISYAVYLAFKGEYFVNVMVVLS